MFTMLSPEKQELYRGFKEFAKKNVEPYANRWDREQAVPADAIELARKMGYLGAMVPEEFGGLGWDCVTFGLFHEAIGKGSVSFGGLFNVHTMVAQTILKWGTDDQKKRWLPALAKGEILGAFALTEPGAGSDIKEIQTEFVQQGDKIVINGKKRWITFGALADLLLVFGKMNGMPTACLVEKNSPGFSVTPVTEMLGFRSAHLAVLEFNDCEISAENIVARPGFAFTHIAPYALEFGRISVAFSTLGLFRGCFEACCAHALERKTFGRHLIDHGAIAEMITEMGVDLEAARHLCLDSCVTKDQHLPEATDKVMMAKYFTTRAAAKHASNAVQIMGAVGCNENSVIARYYRDAKTMEIIEGSTQILQFLLGKNFVRQQASAERSNA